jgi:hypothetical protein
MAGGITLMFAAQIEAPMNGHFSRRPARKQPSLVCCFRPARSPMA